ncbi:glutamate--tRNA ligase [Fulvivirga sp. M361]|uniref:glutamate--tRNA ligase n=1 Tax=Fulvivirga sp. M361 TaxID=2594266 RepID=UPI00117ABB17|nr:glutamate--tRNA ligase [Fulvivirga sp. M361]TRX50413.1 glutamate--tRNA ligase [Fulvivirga sp. M361]
MSNEVRVRFAPSPTGALHIGGLRTAMYNYLFARKHNGTMILRIEDTDQSRYVDGAEEYIKESLKWAGILPDEGPNAGGPYGPYRQSERKDIYGQYAQQLLNSGKAYYAFDTTEELDALRQRLKEAKANSLQYNAITRMQMKNSLTLSAQEVEKRLAAGEPYVIRFKIPLKEDIRINDMVRDWVVVHSSTLDDKILVKSDGMPTYHLANVVDDHLMKITHVIRGEEWLPSAPLHVLLYRALGWEGTMPQFAHLPLLLKPDGNGKLSKRDGDKLGFPVFPINGDFPGKTGKPEHFSGFREAGYLPEAFVNFLALLGWNPGTEQELFSLEELVRHFSLERINKAGAKFDIEKARWFNQQYIKQKSPSELSTYLIKELKNQDIDYKEHLLERICDLMQERIDFPFQLWTEGQFFFLKPTTFDQQLIAKKWTDEAITILTAYQASLAESSDSISAEEARDILSNILDTKGVKMGKVMQALRLAITGRGGGPDLMEIISILGSDEVADRIQYAIDNVKVSTSN